jgi:hypothetical protein
MIISELVSAASSVGVTSPSCGVWTGSFVDALQAVSKNMPTIKSVMIFLDIKKPSCDYVLNNLKK